MKISLLHSKMTGQQYRALLLIIIGLNVPSVICRLDYAQYYISKYHKVSTAEPISPSTTGLSTTIVGSSPSTGVSELTDKITSSEDTSSEEQIFPTKGGQTTGQQGNETVLQRGDIYSSNSDFQSIFIIRIVIIVGSVIFFVCVLGCIVCCCPGCRGRARTGFIVSNRQDQATGVYPQQPLIAQPQTAVCVQHFPPNYSQETAQPYPQQPAQPYVHPYPQSGQQQYSPNQQQYPPNQQQSPAQYNPNNLQFYNPPEAPPPYEDNLPSHKY